MRFASLASCLGLCVTLGLGCGSSPPTPNAPSTSEADVHPAVGDLSALPPPIARAFVDDPEVFPPLRSVEPGDWLDAVHEPGQTFPQFLARDPTRPDATRDTIYIQPFGALPGPDASWPSIVDLGDHIERFFGLEVEVLPAIDLDELAEFEGQRVELEIRDGDFGPQLRTSEILDALKLRLPADAFLLVGLTLEDLYPRDEWNFVFGFASFDRRVCVYSLLRLAPRVSTPRLARELDDALEAQLTLERSVKVMSHELTHSFGVRHCVHYDCLMNGVNHLGELDEGPLHLCPVCLRKLHHVLGFDPAARYQGLADGYEELGLFEAAEWTHARAEALDGT